MNDLTTFKKNFMECKSKNIQDLLNENVIKILTELGIKKNDIINENGNELYEMPEHSKKKREMIFYRDIPKHPIGFYYNADIKNIKAIFDLVQKELTKTDN